MLQVCFVMCGVPEGALGGDDKVHRYGHRHAPAVDYQMVQSGIQPVCAMVTTQIIRARAVASAHTIVRITGIESVTSSDYLHPMAARSDCLDVQRSRVIPQENLSATTEDQQVPHVGQAANDQADHPHIPFQ